MTEDHHLLTISEVVAAQITVARAIPLVDVERWEAAARQQAVRHDTLTSMFDPTAYIRDRSGIQATAEVAAAYLAFRRAVEDGAAR